MNIKLHQIRNMTRGGTVHKKYTISDIVFLHRVPGQRSAIDIRFKSANHPYRIHFESKCSIQAALVCEQFYQLLCTLQCRAAADGIIKDHRLLNALDRGLEKIRVMTATFNLGGYSPPDNLCDIFPLDPPSDVVVVGVQECSYKPVSGDNCDNDFRQILEMYFGSDYALLGSHSIQHTANIKLFVFCHQRNAFKVRHITFDALATGVGNLYGNKGAVGVHFDFHETPMTFVNVHLAAHEGAAAERNGNAAAILNRLNLGSMPDLDVMSKSAYLFFLGDLNYRVHTTHAEAVDVIKSGAYEKLIPLDELKIEQRSLHALTEMKESAITFAPTYRYQVPRGSGELLFSDKKQQTPSYTDRILYHANDDYVVEEVEYTSVPSVTTSDHIPVRGIFNVETQLPFPYKDIDKSSCKRKIVFASIRTEQVKLASAVNCTYDEDRDSAGQDNNGTGPGDPKPQAAKANQKRTKLLVKFHWPLGFDGNCKTSTVEASCSGASEEGDGFTIGAEWSHEQLCVLLPKVTCDEQLRAYHLAFQLCEHREILNEPRVIGSGSVSLGGALDAYIEGRAEESVLDTKVVKHGIRRGNIVFNLSIQDKQ